MQDPDVPTLRRLRPQDGHDTVLLLYVCVGLLVALIIGSAVNDLRKTRRRTAALQRAYAELDRDEVEHAARRADPEE
jgi:multisubunit Na+/H+ antiporter MnhB subunit